MVPCPDASMRSNIAFTGIQKVVRGRAARRTAIGGLAGLVQGVGDCARDIQAAARGVVVGAQEGALKMVLTKVDASLQQTYASSLKPRLSPCPATPGVVRWMAQTLGDRSWDQAHDSLMQSLGSVLADRFLPPAEAIEERLPRRQAYNSSWAAWRRAPWRTRGRMACMFLRAKLLYAYLPYDQTLWLRIGSPDCLLFIVLATLPIARVRNSLYSALLVCLTLPWADASAAQFMQCTCLPPRTHLRPWFEALVHPPRTRYPPCSVTAPNRLGVVRSPARMPGVCEPEWSIVVCAPACRTGRVDSPAALQGHPILLRLAASPIRELPPLEVRGPLRPAGVWLRRTRFASHHHQPGPLAPRVAVTRGAQPVPRLPAHVELLGASAHHATA